MGPRSIRRESAPRVRLMLQVMLALSLLLAAACVSSPVRRYYAFAPQPPLIDAEAGPLPMTVWFQSVEVGPTYNRTQIVYRYSDFELQYFSNRLWADRPERMLQDVVFNAFGNANVFESFQDRVSDRTPSHVLTADVEALEELAGQGLSYAHLAMTLRLSTYETNQEVWQYRIDRKRPVPPDSTELMVRALSEILQQELQRAVVDLRRTLAERPNEEEPAESAPASVLQPFLDDDGLSTFTPSAAELQLLASAGVEIPHASAWMDSQQYNSDQTRLPARMGAVFVPSLGGDGAREPSVLLDRVNTKGDLAGDDDALVPTVLTDDDFDRGEMGRRIPLSPGLYRVYIGSGTLGQRLVKQVAVVEGQVTVIEPFWSALEVQVLDARFVPVRESYELFRMGEQVFADTGTALGAGAGMDEQGYYGTGFGADAELGEQTRVWLLKDGLYKLVQLGSNYRARTNFATVYLLEGELTRFNLVIDPETGNFLGAGVAQQTTDDVEEEAVERAWTPSLSIGGDMLLANSSAAVGQQQGTSLTVNLFADSLLQYQSGPHRWITRAEVEEGQNRNPEGGFRTRTDRLYAHSIYIYQLNELMGPYTRMGAESSLLARTYYLDEPLDVPVLDPDGAQVDLLNDQLSFELAPALSPLNLREGAGVNFQVVRTVPLELNARLGVGARQFLVRAPGYVLTPITSREGDLTAVQQVFGDRLLGMELTLVATARLTRYIQLRSELDALVPPTLGDTYYKWRTITSLRLSTFASLNHRLELTRDTNQSLEQPLAVTNILQLQFFYKPF